MALVASVASVALVALVASLRSANKHNIERVNKMLFSDGGVCYKTMVNKVKCEGIFTSNLKVAILMTRYFTC